MKYLLLIAIISLLAACKSQHQEIRDKHDQSVDEYISQNTKVKSADSPSYHIQVLCYGSAKDLGFDQYYCIHFTNDNWTTFSELMTTWDATTNGIDTTPQIEYQLWLGDKNEAIAIAKGLTTYAACLRSNLNIAKQRDSLYAFRLAHPFPKQPKPKPEEKDTTCCRVVNVY